MSHLASPVAARARAPRAPTLSADVAYRARGPPQAGGGFGETPRLPPPSRLLAPPGNPRTTRAPACRAVCGVPVPGLQLQGCSGSGTWPGGRHEAVLIPLPRASLFSAPGRRRRETHSRARDSPGLAAAPGPTCGVCAAPRPRAPSSRSARPPACPRPLSPLRVSVPVSPGRSQPMEVVPRAAKFYSARSPGPGPAAQS